jgi:hypothetical protein
VQQPLTLQPHYIIPILWHKSSAKVLKREQKTKINSFIFAIFCSSELARLSTYGAQECKNLVSLETKVQKNLTHLNITPKFNTFSKMLNNA